MNILETIGNTPLVQVDKFNNSVLYAKLEYMNPGGSIKDRAALFMIQDALPYINKDTVLIEPTSGNTGIGLAMVARAYGLKLILTMPSNMSIERIKILKAYGAEIITTDSSKGMLGAIEEAKAIAKTFKNSHILSQFDNPSNWKAHYMTTAPEIIKQLPDVSWIVSPVGTGGTIMGIKKFLIDNNINVKVCAVEPQASPVLSGGQAGRHMIAGIGAGFIPSIVDVGLIDRIITITDEEAITSARKLSKDYGIMGGYSSGASYAASIKLANDIKGKIAFIVPDTGMRYLSTDLYNE